MTRPLSRSLLGAVLTLSLAACPVVEEEGPDASQAGADASVAGPDAATAACPLPTGAGTTHDGTTITTDTVWRAADGPHLITFTPRVAAGAKLTIEPCAEVRINGGYGLDVEGTLIARGTATQPITFSRAEAAKAWTFLYSYGGTLDLAYATLRGGGYTGGSNGNAIISVRGDPALPRREALRVQHVTVDGSEQYGVSLQGSAGFAGDSKDLTVKNSQKSAIRAAPHLAHLVPTGAYTGNGADEILVMPETQGFLEDTTWAARGVPYRIGDSQGNGATLVIGSAAPPAVRAELTLQAGVTVKVSKAGRIELAKAGVPAVTTGALVADGTAALPIVFTSAEAAPAAGDWVGLVFADVPDPATKLDNVRIQYAGADSGARSFHCDQTGGFNESENGALLIFGEPSASFLSNSTIADIAGYGVDLAYNGSSVDFMTSNTFENLTKCKQTTPRDAQGGCPANVPCP